MSGKLHELLAVEDDLKGTSKKIHAETLTTFMKKQDHFMSKAVEFHSVLEGVRPELEGEVAMVTTVSDKLNYYADATSKYLDAFLQKESTNTAAKADIILDNGEVLAKDVPATALLGLERELGKVLDVYSVLPTLEPTVVWENDEAAGQGIVRNTQNKVRTKKVTKPFVLYEATERHPAQVEKVSEDIVTGNLTTITKSSKITPARKSLLMKRVEETRRAVKKARMRANTVEHHTVSIGDALFNHINA
jgi:hypothetical protein